jgi:DNA-binding MarR family transcriptional regulator
MTNFTELETKVYEAAQNDDYSSSAKEIAEETGLDIKTVKGVIGSLVKKGRMEVEEEERGGTIFKDVWAVDEDGEIISGY